MICVETATIKSYSTAVVCKGKLSPMSWIYSEFIDKKGHFWGDSVYWTTKLFRAVKEGIDSADIMILSDWKIKWQGKFSIHEGEPRGK